MSMKISSDIKQTIKNYVKYDDYIKDQEKKIRKLKKERDNLSTDIIDFMINENYKNTDIRVGDSRISCQENKSLTSLNQNFIKNQINIFFVEKHPEIISKNKNISTELFNYIINSRKQNKKIALKRIFN